MTSPLGEFEFVSEVANPMQHLVGLGGVGPAAVGDEPARMPAEYPPPILELSPEKQDAIWLFLDEHLRP